CRDRARAAGPRCLSANARGAGTWPRRQRGHAHIHCGPGDQLAGLPEEMMSTLMTRRMFLRGSAVVMAGAGTVPLWLARAAAAEGKKRKVLIAIFQRGA